MSPKVQNETLQILSNTIFKEISQEIKSLPVVQYSLILFESICLRFIDRNLEAGEEFSVFYEKKPISDSIPGMGQQTHCVMCKVYRLTWEKSSREYCMHIADDTVSALWCHLSCQHLHLLETHWRSWRYLLIQLATSDLSGHCVLPRGPNAHLLSNQCTIRDCSDFITEHGWVLVERDGSESQCTARVSSKETATQGLRYQHCRCS